MLNKLQGLPRNYKRLLMLATDLVAIPFAYWLAFNLRLDFHHLFLNPLEWLVIALTTAVTMAVFVRTGLYRAVIRYIGIHAGLTVLKGAAISAVFLTFFAFVLDSWHPRSVPFIYFTLLLLLVGGSRFLVRHWMQSHEGDKRRRVAIYGAGAAGTQVMMSLLNSPEYKPVLFVDDNPDTHGRVINGVLITSPKWLKEQYRNLGIRDVVLAMPRITRSRKREIIDLLAPLPLHVHSIPGMEDLMSGRARIEEIRDVGIEDLLGRDAVAPDRQLMGANIRDKVVLVTGAGGSIGSELCRQIVLLGPRQLILLEQSEFALYNIERELPGETCQITPILGSVMDRALLASVLSSWGVQTVFHAAAYKHVPLVESNIIAGITNNVFGSRNVAELSGRFKVETCVLISTDKAVRPCNVMGASKRLAELIFQGLQSSRSRTNYSMVRFGNVLGSSGSVIPLFREQISRGGPVTVTHPDIIRYFMTIPEAAQLVLQAGAMARGGEVFVLDMGEPVKIADLARKMVALMGMTVRDDGDDAPDGAHDEGEIEIVYTGLRPGEKLYEELLIGENATPTDHPRILQADEVSVPWEQLEQELEALAGLCEEADCERIRNFLMRMPLGYLPQGPGEDLVWGAKQDVISAKAGLEARPDPAVAASAQVVYLNKKQELSS